MGLGLGFLNYFIIKPEPPISELSLQAALIPAIILLVFTGFVEEVVFRGLIQEASIEKLGLFGLVYGALVFAGMHLSDGAGLDIGFAFIFGLGGGLIVLKTSSLLGVSLAHGLMNVSSYLLLPFLL